MVDQARLVYKVFKEYKDLLVNKVMTVLVYKVRLVSKVHKVYEEK